MLSSFQDRMELMDVQTMRKRRNRLLLYDDSMQDTMLRSKAIRIKAMQDLKPLYAWNDRFNAGSFLLVSRAKGKKYQLDEATNQLDELSEMINDLLNAQADRANENYAGLGNELMDIDDTLSKSGQLQNQRVLEKILVEENSNTDLSNAIKKLRNDVNTPDNYTINNMNMTAKAQYLVETLGFGESEIKNAF
jgi:hypothetical protein